MAELPEIDALPTAEVFFVSALEARYNRDNADHANGFTLFDPGWYVREFGVVYGPYDSEEEATNVVLLGVS